MPKSGFGGCRRRQEIAECPRIDRLAFLATGIGYGVMEVTYRATFHYSLVKLLLRRASNRVSVVSSCKEREDG
jgi:hypothetical protein